MDDPLNGVNDWIERLACPSSRQPLRPATPEEMAALRATIAPSDGEAAWDGALVTADGRIAYPIRCGIPVLLAEAAVRLP